MHQRGDDEVMMSYGSMINTVLFLVMYMIIIWRLPPTALFVDAQITTILLKETIGFVYQ